jgi:cation diffusion facilitator family transporter
VVRGRLTTTPSSNIEAIKSRALRLSLLGLLSVFIFEFVAGLLTNSLALIMDGTHALFDAVVTAILIIAVRLALKPKDIDHTYGHGKIETIGGLIGGIALFVVAIIFIHEAILRLISSDLSSLTVVNPGTIGFAAIVYTLAVDGFRIGILGRAMKKAAASQITNPTSLKADFYHAFADLASTAVALAGLWLVTIGFGEGDSIAAITLGIFLSYLSVRFAYQNAMELTDVISPGLVGTVQQAANETQGVIRSDDIKMRQVGREIFVETTIALPAEISFESAHAISAQVEDNIARRLSSSGRDVKPKNITVHFEPSMGLKPLPELAIESAASQVSGVKGVHNIIISRIAKSSSINTSLHIQVNRSAPLAEAHSIANAVEDSIKKQLTNVEDVIVHIEPMVPNVDEGIELIEDRTMDDFIVNTILDSSYDVRRVNRVWIYRTLSNMLKIDVNCSFSSEMTIEQIHERVSEIEKEIRTKYPGSIVTIHSEPS